MSATQAMAFLTKYRELRLSNSVGQDEIEYNFGRGFHQLGLFTIPSEALLLLIFTFRTNRSSFSRGKALRTGARYGRRENQGKPRCKYSNLPFTFVHLSIILVFRTWGSRKRPHTICLSFSSSPAQLLSLKLSTGVG